MPINKCQTVVDFDWRGHGKIKKNKKKRSGFKKKPERSLSFIDDD